MFWDTSLIKRTYIVTEQHRPCQEASWLPWIFFHLKTYPLCGKIKTAKLKFKAGEKMVTQLKYSNTNTYLISGQKGCVLFDTGWAGTFGLLCKALGEKNITLQQISCLIISHFHPDHMGLAGELAEHGIEPVIADVQLEYVHASDHIFRKENNRFFVPLDENKAKIVSIRQSRKFLKSLGISGELIHTPGHSPDSICVWLDDDKSLLVGDLAPLYELEMHKNTPTGESWERLLKLRPKRVYYGHAKTAELGSSLPAAPCDDDLYALVKRIIKLCEKGQTPEKISLRTNAPQKLVKDVLQIYVTHPGVSINGILDRLEIKDL